MIGKLLIKVGSWLTTHFPEKISADQVYSEISYLRDRCTSLDTLLTQLKEAQENTNAGCVGLDSRLVELTRKVEGLTTENTALKAQAALRTRTSVFPIPGR